MAAQRGLTCAFRSLLQHRLPTLILACLLLAACSSVLPSTDPSPVPALERALQGGDGTVTSRRVDAELAPAEDQDAPVDEVYPAEESEDTVDRPRVVQRSGDLTLSFQDADLSQVLRVILGDLLRTGYVLPPDLSGRVTLRTVRPLTRRQLQRTLDGLLAANGLQAVYEPSMVRVIRPVGSGSASGQPTPQVGGPGTAIDAIPLSHVSADRMAKLLTPVLGEGRLLVADPISGMVLVSGTRAEREAARDAVAVFDVDAMAGRPVAMVGLTEARAETVIEDLGQLFAGDREASRIGQVRFIPIRRMNAILAIAATDDALERARTWIKRLDRTRNADQSRLFVYFVRNSTADRLVETLRGAFGEAGLVGSAAASDADEAANSDDGVASQTLAASQDTPRFMADEQANAILVWATRRNWELIEEVLTKLDITPLQVLIEGTVIEVQLKDALRFGVQYFIEAGDFTGLLSRGTALDSVTPTVPGLGLTIGASGDSRVVIDALSELTDVRVVSSPQLLVLDGETAQLHVGDQVPIIRRSSSTTATDDSRIVNEIEYRDTGVSLEVTPKVKASGVVTLEITQEVSDVSRTDTSDIDSPTISQRQIISTAAVESGSTVLLAGLIREATSQDDSGIPVLHRIPVVGSLFGSTDTDRERTELVLLLTPRVIDGRSEAEDVTKSILERYEGLLDRAPGSSTPAAQ